MITLFEEKWYHRDFLNLQYFCIRWFNLRIVGAKYKTSPKKAWILTIYIYMKKIRLLSNFYYTHEKRYRHRSRKLKKVITPCTKSNTVLYPFATTLPKGLNSFNFHFKIFTINIFFDQVNFAEKWSSNLLAKQQRFGPNLLHTQKILAKHKQKDPLMIHFASA